MSWLRFFSLWGVFGVLTISSSSIQVQAQTESPVSAGQMVRIGVTVPPKADSLVTDMAVEPVGNQISVGQQATYTFSYRSKNSEPVPLILQATWGSQDDLQSVKKTVRLVYVMGSATPAYGGTLPVIDQEARTITWNVVGLPSSPEYQTVSFQLVAVAESHSETNTWVPVSFQFISVDNSRPRTLRTVIKASPLMATNAAFELVSQTLEFNALTLAAVNDTAAQIQVSANQPVVGQLWYGFAPETLDQTALVTGQDHQLTFWLQNLYPNARMYYRVVIENEHQAKKSDIFTFTTAKVATQTTLEPWALSLAYRNSVLRQGLVTPLTDQTTPLTIEAAKKLDVVMSLPGGAQLAEVNLKFKPVEVADSYRSALSASASYGVAQLQKAGDQSLVGTLIVPSLPGRYQLVTLMSDTVGNSIATPLLWVEVMPPIQVLDHHTKQPLVGVEVNLYKENELTGGFELVQDRGIAIENPQRSDSQGIVEFNLSPGRYQLRSRVTGYQPETAEFLIESADKTQLPTISMTPVTQSIVGRLIYRVTRMLE